MAVVWKDEYSSGYGFIDTGHRMVVDAINRLNKGSGEKAVTTVLEALETQLRLQFHHEEALMMVSRSKRLENHRDEHRRIIKVLEHLRESHRSGEQVGSLLRINLVAFLRTHLQGSDVDEFGDDAICRVA